VPRRFVSFPHPVLGNRDDVGGVFRLLAESSYRPNALEVQFNLEFELDNPELEQLLLDDEVRGVVTIACSRTFYMATKELDLSSSGDHRYRAKIEIPRTEIAGSVSVQIAVVVDEDLDSYELRTFHEDFEGAVFEPRLGQILAQTDDVRFQIDQEWDPLDPPTSSFLKIVVADFPFDGDLQVDSDDEDIQVTVSRELKASVDALPAQMRDEYVLAAIVLPGLAEAITHRERQLTETSAQHDGDEPRMWERAIEQRLNNLGAHGLSPIQTASILLDSPTRRAAQIVTTLVDDEEDAS
jgi:hypothetical protein